MHMFLNHAEVVLSTKKHARDIVGIWLYSVQLRHILCDSDITNYRFDRNLQVWSAGFRVETFRSFYWRISCEPFFRQRGETCVRMQLQQEQQRTNKKQECHPYLQPWYKCASRHGGEIMITGKLFPVKALQQEKRKNSNHQVTYNK